MKKFLLIALVAAVVGIAIWVAWPRTPVPSILLPVGSRVTRLKVTTGMKHV